MEKKLDTLEKKITELFRKILRFNRILMDIEYKIMIINNRIKNK